MNAKKTRKASLEGKRVFYFLIGLNLVLLGVWMLFGMQTINADFVEVAVVDEKEVPISVPIFEIEEKMPEIKEPEPEIEKIPEPELVDLVEVNEPVEESVPLEEPKRVIPDIPVVNTTTKQPNRIIDTGHLKTIVEEVKEEREIVLTPARVDQMAIYPGCEQHKGNKRALMKCFGEKLSADMVKYLDTEFPNVDKEMVQVQLEFVVNTNGEIVDINPARGDEAFKPQAKEALEKVANRLKRKNKKITPAKMNTGKDVLLLFKNSIKLKKP